MVLLFFLPNMQTNGAFTLLLCFALQQTGDLSNVYPAYAQQWQL